MLLILSVEGLAWFPLICHSFVGWNEYQGAGGWSGAVSIPGKGCIIPLGVGGRARGTPCGIDSWDDTSCPDTDWPGLGGLVGGRARLTRYLVPMNQIHCPIQESGSYSMVLEMAVPTSFLLQGSKSLQISHHGKFWSVSGLHPRIGILWIPVHIWQRSFLVSLAWVYVSSFLNVHPS